MLNHSSARERKGTPHANKGIKHKTLNLNGSSKKIVSDAFNGTSRKRISRSTTNRTLDLDCTGKTTISNALRRRAQSVIKDKSIDAQSRVLIRYALETNDPWLPELVRRADAGETIIYTVNSLKHPHPRGFKRRKD